MNSKLPININDLINGLSVEWERIEFKEGWNPADVIHSICAFTNDFNNLGGGYIIIGIGEKKGKPILPPKGLTQNQADSIQKELLNLGYKVQPNYFPLVFPEKFQKKLILIIWAFAGDNRPYKAPDRLGKSSSYSYYIRRYSNTVRVKNGSQEERRLIELAARIPFDDRINTFASIDDLDLRTIKNYLKEINSDLFKIADKIPFIELCRQIQIVRGSIEFTKPLNVGLLMFSKNPAGFFYGARIDIVEFEDENGDEYTEKKFSGPLQVQLRDALSYFENIVLKEKVKKISGKAESERVFNYPYEAFEESLANAVYHRSYEDDRPIEISIHKNRIEIISYPGALPPITNNDFKRQRIVARDYRNRRIGDFLKELHLTEGRATGIPKIKNAMKNNGSPSAIFEMDKNRSYFLVTLPVHKDFRYSPKSARRQENALLNKTAMKILKYCARPRKRSDILRHIGLSNHSKNFKTYLVPLLNSKLLGMTIPDKPNSKNQSYLITVLGKKQIGTITTSK